MHELGIESSVLQDILSGRKTIEGRLGKPKFLKIKAGDEISLREDIWDDGKIVGTLDDVATIVVKQVLYFTSFEEMLNSLDHQAAIPSAETIADAMDIYRQFYTPEDEEEYGVVAFIFALT